MVVNRAQHRKRVQHVKGRARLLKLVLVVCSEWFLHAQHVTDVAQSLLKSATIVKVEAEQQSTVNFE
jgi:hypothetical protein